MNRRRFQTQIHHWNQCWLHMTLYLPSRITRRAHKFPTVFHTSVYHTNHHWIQRGIHHLEHILNFEFSVNTVIRIIATVLCTNDFNTQPPKSLISWPKSSLLLTTLHTINLMAVSSKTKAVRHHQVGQLYNDLAWGQQKSWDTFWVFQNLGLQ